MLWFELELWILNISTADPLYSPERLVPYVSPILLKLIIFEDSVNRSCTRTKRNSQKLQSIY